MERFPREQLSVVYWVCRHHVHIELYLTVADPGNMERGFTNGGKYIRQLGGVGERCKLPHRGLGRSPRSFASYHYCFSESTAVCSH